jgi:hypothetical protein
MECIMTETATCPKCAGKLLWNGTAMTCITCTTITPARTTKTPSERKIPAPKKGK